MKSKVAAFICLATCFFLIILQTDDQEVLIQSQESKTVDEQAVFNRIKWFRWKNKDVWMMNQSHHGLQASADQWDRLAIVVDHDAKPKTAKFYQLTPGKLEWQAEPIQERAFKMSCFMCHSNGPRSIRPERSGLGLSWKDEFKIAMMNLRIKTYGRIVLHPDHQKNDPFLEVPARLQSPFENEKLELITCNRCHQESGFFARGKLLRQNIPTMQFLTEAGHMPPIGFGLSQEEKRKLRRFFEGF